MKRMALRRILAALCCLALLPVAGCAGGQDVLLADKDGAQALCLGVLRHGFARLGPHAGEQLVLCCPDAPVEPGTVLLGCTFYLTCAALGVQDSAQDGHIRGRLLLKSEAAGLLLAPGADLLLGLKLLHGIQTADLLRR